MQLQKPNIWRKLNQFVDSHRKLSIILVCGMILLGSGTVGLGYFFQTQPTALMQPEVKAQTVQTAPDGTKTFYSPLTGKQVPDEATTKRQVTAIMLENSPDSRPQSGLKASGVVFEAIAEGGITRFLTLRQEDRSGLIGPVRSLRPYYIDWLAPFDASVAHVGGSANALGEIRNGSYKDIDQFFAGSFYWRATDRYAPHNVYTNSDKLDALNASKGFTSSTFNGFIRKQDSPSATPNATQISVTVSGPTYNSAYSYDAPSNSYIRSQAGKPHTDRETGQITPKTIIVMKVPVQIGYEDGYREQMSTLGHNQAYIFQDGIVTDGFWRKDSKKDQIKFYDKAGVAVALNPGQTWITVVAPDKAVSWR